MKLRLSSLWLSLGLCAFTNSFSAKIGVNFYDEANFLPYDQRHSPAQMAAVPRLVYSHFDILRTITDGNEGDPGQYICSCYRIGNNIVNPKQCTFQRSVDQTQHLKVILTVENPEKWLSTQSKAISYLYQFVLPLQQNTTLPTDPALRPNFWGIQPASMGAAGCDLTASTNHILAIVVGLEVGAHINPIGHDFQHKAQQINKLDQYVANLIAALKQFNLKKQIYVTTSVAPSNCDIDSGHCGQILELLPLNRGHYALNMQRHTIAGQTIDFSHVYQALKQINQQDYSGEPLGILLSLYHYWQYFPNQNLLNFDITTWASALDQQHELIQSAIHQQPGLSNLPVSIGEVGWPASGDNNCDGAPNQPSALVQQRILHAVQHWSTHDPLNPPPMILFWRMFEIDHNAAANIACALRNPEVAYGLFPGDLRTLYLNESITPRAGDNFPNFKSTQTDTPTPPVVTLPPLENPEPTTPPETLPNTSMAVFYCPTSGNMMHDATEDFYKLGDWHYMLFPSHHQCAHGAEACVEYQAENGPYSKLYCARGNATYQIGYLWQGGSKCRAIDNGFTKDCQPVP